MKESTHALVNAARGMGWLVRQLLDIALTWLFVFVAAGAALYLVARLFS